jgi:hypothetical protein
MSSSGFRKARTDLSIIIAQLHEEHRRIQDKIHILEKIGSVPQTRLPFRGPRLAGERAKSRGQVM